MSSRISVFGMMIWPPAAGRHNAVENRLEVVTAVEINVDAVGMRPGLFEFKQAAADTRFCVGQHGHAHPWEAGVDGERGGEDLFVELHRAFEIGSRYFKPVDRIH